MARRKKDKFKLYRTRSEAHTYMELPASVRTILRGYVQDIPRFRATAADPNYSAEARRHNTNLLSRLDAAAPDMEPEVKRILLDDIAYLRGYDKSELRDMMARPTYYRSKNKLEVALAKALKLIWPEKTKK